MASISNYRPKGTIWIENAAGVSTASNVGIGLSIPTSKLTVAGDGLFTGIVTAAAFYGSGIGITGIVGNISESSISGVNVTIDGDSETAFYLKLNQATPGITTAFYNFIVGVGAGKGVLVSNGSNLLGRYSGYNNFAGNDNNFLGQYSGYNNTTGSNSVFIGHSCGYNNTTGSNLLFLGNQTGYNNTSGNHNIFFGFRSGFNILSGSSNIFIGHSCGYEQVVGNGNVLIGERINSLNINGSNQLAIGSSLGSWIRGNENFNVGIGTTNPTSKLTVGGDIKVGLNTSQGVILTAANGNQYRLIVGNSGELITVAV